MTLYNSTMIELQGKKIKYGAGWKIWTVWSVCSAAKFNFLLNITAVSITTAAATTWKVIY